MACEKTERNPADSGNLDPEAGVDLIQTFLNRAIQSRSQAGREKPDKSFHTLPRRAKRFKKLKNFVDCSLARFIQAPNFPNIAIFPAKISQPRGRRAKDIE